MPTAHVSSALGLDRSRDVGKGGICSLGLQVDERGDLLCRSELDRKVDESFDLKWRDFEINPSVFPGPNVPVLAAAVTREDDPLVLALPQVVLDELVNQLVGEMLQDVLGYEQVRSGEVLGDVADLKLDLAFSYFLRTASITSEAMSTPR